MLALAWGEVLFIRCGAIGWLLWAISVVTVALIIQYFIAVRRMNIVPDLVREQIRSLFDGKQYREAIELTAAEPSFLSYVIHAALAEAAHGYAAMERALEEASEQRTTKLLRSIEWLNLIGNIGPMLGLMGTVYGMIRVFFKIVEAKGMPRPEALADGIGIALVTTLVGLFVAIPALATYAVMRNRIDSLSAEAMITSQELIATFRPAKKA
ncbi:MAG TPA: MotA/TolQ/ExbB proton channel family protein [Phycisphaerae bacterium]|nr:MotA/TolQ/ExbB proton channel family protein [Phycisphaerae bacterium]